MGGQIGINSEVGIGSEFWFTAVFKKQTEPAETLTTEQLPEMKDLHILVVDDNETSREILLSHLSAWGFRVSTASSGQDAMEKFDHAVARKEPFQIAVLDMQMPGMDGLSLGKAIKGDDRFKSVHLVMMTSMGQAGDARRFEKAGFAAYLIKPVGHSDLFGCLKTILSGGPELQVENTIITRHTVRERKRRNIRILLAEDNITNQQVATGILKKFGFVGVKTVENGALAVKELEKASYDLVLMDIQMPEMDGHEATRQIRKIEAGSGRKKTPIIAMTAHAMKKDQDNCRDAGMDDYVSKPINAEVLLDTLERWLPKEPQASEPPPVLDHDRPHPGETAAESSPLVFDKAALMERLMGDTKLLGTVIEGFLGDMPRQIAALKTYIDQKNYADAGKQGHQIKGACGNMGADALMAIAAKIEMAGKAGDSDSLASLFPQLETAFDQFKHTMEAMI